MESTRLVKWVLCLLLIAFNLIACQSDRSVGFEEAGGLEQEGSGHIDGAVASSEAIPDVSGVLQEAISRSADAIFEGINLERTQKGLPGLELELSLVEMAYERSVDMAVRGYLDHTSPEDSQVYLLTTLPANGFSGQAAELIYATSIPIDKVPQECLDTWLDDGDHLSILVNPVFHYAGLGLMGDGRQWIVTMILVESRS